MVIHHVDTPYFHNNPDWCVYIQPSRDVIYGIIGDDDDAHDQRLSRATIVRMSVAASSSKKPRRGTCRMTTIRGRWAQSLVRMIDSGQFVVYPSAEADATV